MKPSIGRIVHYVAYGTEGGPYPKGVHHAAVITALARDATNPRDEVNLCVFYENGTSFKLNIPYDAEQRPGTWHWPEGMFATCE
jgi:hypothetical protein